jgi:hypothetical protein
MVTHEFAENTTLFAAVVSGQKTHVICQPDSVITTGDAIRMREVLDTGAFSGREAFLSVTYVTRQAECALLMFQSVFVVSVQLQATTTRPPSGKFQKISSQ